MNKWNIISSKNLANIRLDPEFYKKELTDMDSKIEQIGSFKLGDLIHELTDYTANGSFASLKYNVKVSDAKNFAKWIRIQNLDANNYTNNIRYVTEHSYNFLKKSKLIGGELLISKTGEYLGKAYLFNPNENNYYTLADNIFLLRLKDDNYNGYVFSFINSRIGRKLLLRWSQGTGQPTIIKDSLRSVRLPIINDELKAYFNLTILKYYELQKQSQDLYEQAIELLDKELELHTKKFEKPRSYTASFSEVIDFSRFDSEHYQPKFRKINQVIKSYHNGYEKLLDNITSVKPSYNLSLHPDKYIQYIELSKINPSMGFIETINKMNKKDAPSRAKRIVSTGDVIASSIVGSVDKAGLVSEYEDGYIASNGFFQFRSDYYSPEFLLILIKSKLIKEQFHQQSTGGILSAVSDQNLKYLIIPKIEKTLQDKITSLVKDAHIKIRQSKELLEQAKQRVEELIENAAGEY